MNDILSQLKQNALLEKVPEDQLKWLIEKSEIRNCSPGERIFSKGDLIQNMLIILEGGISLKSERNGQFQEFTRVEKNDITGALPYSRGKISFAQGFAVEETQLLVMDKTHFPEMIKGNYELTEALVHVMTNRVREFTKQGMHDEKMLALGKISAGLAHELNNPSSAIVRAASELKRHLAAVPEKFKKVISIRLSNQQVDTVNDILFSRLKERNNLNISLMERTSREDEIIRWLEEHGIEDSYSMAPNFVEFGITTADLLKILDETGEQFLPPVVEWIDNNLTTEKLVTEIEDSSHRIDNLVKSIKEYSHMDKALDKLIVNVRKGIETTLTMLGHKLKKKNISVELELDNIPAIKAFPGELNQVWTNLIDNAIDAMNNRGKLRITAKQDNEFLEIKFIDNGSGIPDDIQSRIFDPFFSTKKFGEGTGLGLDIVKRIMNNHNAQIKVKSTPGETEFTLCFPLK